MWQEGDRQLHSSRIRRALVNSSRLAEQSATHYDANVSSGPRAIQKSTPTRLRVPPGGCAHLTASTLVIERCGSGLNSCYELIITIGALMEIEAGVIEMLLAPHEIVTPDKPLIEILPTSA